MIFIRAYHQCYLLRCIFSFKMTLPRFFFLSQKKPSNYCFLSFRRNKTISEKKRNEGVLISFSIFQSLSIKKSVYIFFVCLKVWVIRVFWGSPKWSAEDAKLPEVLNRNRVIICRVFISHCCWFCVVAEKQK